MHLLEGLVKKVSFYKKSCQLVDSFTICNMSEVGRYTGMDHGSDTKATNKIVDDGDGLFYLNC